MREKISLREKIAYASTDLASNFIWTMVSAFLAYFYTDVAGLAAGSLAVLLLVTRILDAIVDPAVGVIIDKTHTKWGKCRPYFLWMCLPVAVMLILTFTAPDLSPTGKLIYAYVTYGVLGILYSAVNLPVTAILPRLAADSGNRTVLGVFRMVGALFGGLSLSVITLPLVNILAHTKSNADISAMSAVEHAAYMKAQAHGFQMVAIIYAIIAVLLFIFAFFNLKERVSSSNEKAGQPFAVSIKALKGNLPWLLVMLMGLIGQLVNSMRQAGLLYYLKWNLGRADLVPIMGTMMIFILFPMIFTPVLVGKIGKRNTVILGNVVSLIGYLIIWPIGGHSIVMLFIGNIIASIGMGFGLALVGVMIADTVDYGEWKNGIRAEGLLSAAVSFGQKVGTGLGGSLALWILAAGAYNGEAQIQQSSALHAISINYCVAPIVAAVATIIIMLFYNLDKEMPQMLEDLKENRISQN